MSSSDPTFVPTSAADILQSRRRVEVTLSTGLQFRCKRLELFDLLYCGYVRFDQVGALTRMTQPGRTLSDVLQEFDQTERDASFEALRRVAELSALEPKVAAVPASADEIPSDTLTYHELVELATKVIGMPRLPGAAVDTFRGTRARDDESAAPAGEDVRPEAKQLDPGGSVELIHG
jgi:hypothetical protein